MTHARTPGELVRDLLAACARVDLDTVVGMVTEDVEYDNVPVGKVRGPEDLRAALAGGMLEAADEVDWVVLRQAECGDLVMNERIDRFRVGTNWIEVQVAGVFEVSGGLIRLWRDYFDLDSYRRQKRSAQI